MPMTRPCPPRASRIVGLALMGASVWGPIGALGADLVAPQRKPAQGRLVSVEQGDVACHLVLTDGAGREHREMADFVLCDSAKRLAGQSVSLSYTPTRVMAAACQGDPACTRYDMVALVTRVTPTPPAGASAASPALNTSWCRPGETDVFTCDAGQKRVSLCVSEGVSAQRGQLMYRFGPTAASAPELELPSRPTAPSSTATGEAVGFAGGGGVWLRFARGNHAYVVYSGVGRWGRNGATEERHGVLVERSGQPIATLACASPRVNELGPDWLQRLGTVPDAQGFVFPNTGK